MATHPLLTQPQEQTSFTSQPSAEPWVLTPGDAEAVIDSWETRREPGQELKASYRQYLETIQQP